MINYAEILTRRFPGVSWSIDNDDIDTLTALDNSELPTKETILALWPSVQSEIENEKKEKEKTKAEVLKKLGITEDEIKTLLQGLNLA